MLIVAMLHMASEHPAQADNCQNTSVKIEEQLRYIFLFAFGVYFAFPRGKKKQVDLCGIRLTLLCV